jgi:hypothetical protein
MRGLAARVAAAAPVPRSMARRLSLTEFTEFICGLLLMMCGLCSGDGMPYQAGYFFKGHRKTYFIDEKTIP